MSESPHVVSDGHATMAIGYISAELAARADAWNGNAPDWLPEPPDWLDLWEHALDATKSDAEADLATV
jgi:hypothetical protein